MKLYYEISDALLWIARITVELIPWAIGLYALLTVLGVFGHAYFAPIRYIAHSLAQ